LQRNTGIHRHTSTFRTGKHAMTDSLKIFS
jgi:hypothetical protein